MFKPVKESAKAVLANQIKKMIDEADGIVILSGAGMSVDSGIPDFRGKDGIWTSEQSNFMKFATADAFALHPLEAWNFYITRLITGMSLTPHKGYVQLLRLKELGKDIFSVTSNVDGHFLKAGYDSNKLLEIHGNLRYIQCVDQCTREDWPMPNFTDVLTNEKDIPTCPNCGSYLRPKVMMFNDPAFCFNRVDEQQRSYTEWESDKKNIVGIEIGAGKTIPSIRWFGAERTSNLIRINLYEPDISRKQDISMQMNAIDGIDLLTKIIFNGE